MRRRKMTMVTLCKLLIITGIIMHFMSGSSNIVLITIHKLAAVGAAVLMVMEIKDYRESIRAKPKAFAMIALASLSVMVLFISGALMSLEGYAHIYGSMTLAHVAATAAAIATIVLFHRLLLNK
ncbi:MAG TPA: hypothetical protein PK718_08540 [Candidatus Methanofastidiosa archaeon]|nr:hypothetical protein [Candidatus Methanofastidiosa archaeon]HPR42573.1 hypothetical protein [Candidatus Methanofastidiosa archaeon]